MYVKTMYLCYQKCSSSSSIYYLGKVAFGQSFHRSPPPNLPIPCILLHYSPLFHVFLYHVNPSFHWLPLFLHPSIFNSNTLYLHLLISSYNMSKPPQSFCLKCSSRSFTPTLDAITVLSTISFNVTPQIILSILFSVARSL